METVSLGMLDASGVDAARGKDTFMLGCKILTNDGDDADVSKKAGSKCKVRGCTSKAMVYLAVGGLNAIECYGADDENRHARGIKLSCCWIVDAKDSNRLLDVLVEKQTKLLPRGEGDDGVLGEDSVLQCGVALATAVSGE